jgi:hypothetical protein
VNLAEQLLGIVTNSPAGRQIDDAALQDALVGALFIGFFGAMALVNVITGWVLRSVASWTYAALMLVMVAILLFSITHAAFGGNPVHAILVCAYLIATVAFAFALLRTWRYDRAMGWIVAGLLALNVPLVFVEFMMGVSWTARFYAIDQIAFDLLLVALIVLGVRALVHEGVRVAGAYLAAFFLPAIGSILDDLATNLHLSHSLVYSFDAGVAWRRGGRAARKSWGKIA